MKLSAHQQRLYTKKSLARGTTQNADYCNFFTIKFTRHCWLLLILAIKFTQQTVLTNQLIQSYILNFEEICFPIWRNSFCILKKSILQFREIHFATWRNTFCNLEKYILQLGQSIWPCCFFFLLRVHRPAWSRMKEVTRPNFKTDFRRWLPTWWKGDDNIYLLSFQDHHWFCPFIGDIDESVFDSWYGWNGSLS